MVHIDFIKNHTESYATESYNIMSWKDLQSIEAFSYKTLKLPSFICSTLQSIVVVPWRNIVEERLFFHMFPPK